MLQCVLYVFLGGMAMINSGCALDSDYVLVDRIEHVQSYAPQYAPSNHKIYYSTPFVVWNSDYRYWRKHYSYYSYPRYLRRGYYPKRRYKKYHPRYRPRAKTRHVKIVKPYPYKKHKKKKFKKKRRK